MARSPKPNPAFADADKLLGELRTLRERSTDRGHKRYLDGLIERVEARLGRQHEVAHGR